MDENTQEFQEEAKSTANEFSKGAKEAYEDLTSNKNNKKVLAGILGIIFGALGAHKFVLGYTKEGLIMLIATLVLGILSFGFLVWLVGLLGFVEGILYLTKSDEEFYQTYQVGKKPWF
ncbi:MAG: TM2 domain-containing protein [Flavobacteriaceae bacterium]|nr:TM2 domain-containing protein [Flavobacteriaceae bacterium]